ALMNSIEGKRGNPRIKPPFPAERGVFGMPTTINNVETLAAVPPIVKRGAAWYKAMSLSSPKSTGTKVLSVCGHVQKRGNYEVTRGHRVDHEDPGADPRRAGEDVRPRPAARPRRQHDREDDLRAIRLLRRSGALGAEEIPRRVRGLHNGKPEAGPGCMITGCGMRDA